MSCSRSVGLEISREGASAPQGALRGLGETSTDPRGEPQYRGCQTQVPLIFETLKMILKSNLLGSVLLKQHKFIRVYRRDSPDDPVVKNITDLIYIQLLEV